MKQSTSGFTIVELLIVIVVIAILAAISIVAYTGIQDRASNAVVQTDLNNFSKKAEEFKALNGHYPINATELETLRTSGFRATKNVYDTARILNFSYCITSGGAGYAISGITKSNKRFFVSSRTGVAEYSSSTVNDGNESAENSNCGDLLAGSFRLSGGYYSVDPNGWRSWTGN